jgi:hypothetical protein
MWVDGFTSLHTYIHRHTVQSSVQLHRLLVESPLSPCFQFTQIIIYTWWPGGAETCRWNLHERSDDSISNLWNCIGDCIVFVCFFVFCVVGFDQLLIYSKHVSEIYMYHVATLHGLFLAEYGLTHLPAKCSKECCSTVLWCNWNIS